MRFTTKIATFILFLFASQTLFAQLGVQTARRKSTTSEEITLERAMIEEPTEIGEEAPSETCNVGNGFWPLHNKKAEDASCFWNQKQNQEVLKYARFVTSSKTFTASTDMLTDVFGTVRVAFSGAVAANTTGENDNEETTAADDGDGGDDEPTAGEDKTLNLFKTNGGNLALTASYPVYYKPIGEGQLLWNAYVRFAGNVDAMGGDTNDSTTDEGDVNGNVELAFSEFQLDLLSFHRDFNLLGYAKTSAVVGTKKFAEALGDGVGRSFLHGQLGAGLRMSNKITVYFTYNWYSDGKVPGDGGAVSVVLGD